MSTDNDGKTADSAKASPEKKTFSTLSIVGAATALLTAVLGSTGITGFFQLKQEEERSRAQIAMAKEKQTHDLSFDYLREAIKKDQAEIDRRASLEFVRATQPDESKLAIWATREIERMDRRIEEQKAELLAVINKNTPHSPASPGDRDQPPPPLSKEASVALKEYQALSRLTQDNGAGGGAKATPTQKLLQALIQLGVTASDANAFAGPLTEVMKNLDISTTQRRAHFLGQVMVESNRFKGLVENFNYKNPERLDAIFRSVNGVEDARTLIARGPEAIANRV